MNEENIKFTFLEDLDQEIEIKKYNDILEIEKEMNLIREIYQEIETIIKEDDLNLKTVENIIEENKEVITVSENEINISNKIQDQINNKKYLFLSGGIGGITFGIISIGVAPQYILSNIFGGMFIGSIYGFFINKFLDENKNK